MQLRAVATPSLPKLAWVADVDHQTGIVRLQHGSSLEVRQNFFIEGVWNGSFQNGDFGETDCVFGSGAILSGESILFVTSATTVDSLHYAEEGAHVTVSNSLPLLLAFIGDALNPRCPNYPLICDSVMAGMNDYQRNIPTKRGNVRRQIYRNFDVSRDKVLESEKRMPPTFNNFVDYRDYIRRNYELIAANARDRALIQMKILSQLVHRAPDLLR